jgi:hypothetical protein
LTGETGDGACTTGGREDIALLRTPGCDGYRLLRICLDFCSIRLK